MIKEKDTRYVYKKISDTSNDVSLLRPMNCLCNIVTVRFGMREPVKFWFVGEPLNHIHQDTKSARLIAVCKRRLKLTCTMNGLNGYD